MDFWLTRGLDLEYGGVYGTLDRDGNPVEGLTLGVVNGYAIDSTDKGIIQQARHLWALSTYHQSLVRQGVEPSPDIRDAAESCRAFMLDYLLDRSDNRFYFMVSRDGSDVVHPGKNFYGNLFAIYGLSKYAEVFGSDESRDQAMATFLSYDATLEENGIHDAVFKGYDETGLIPVKDNSKLPSGRLSKTLDTLLHALEALTQLYKVVEDEQISQRVADRILELLEIAEEKGVNNDGFYLYENFDTEWNNLGSAVLCYGHQLEFMWLAMDAVDVLLSRAQITGEKATEMKDLFVKIGQLATAQGYDSEQGGLFLAGTVHEEPHRKDKHWWAQAEAMNGFWTIFQYTGQKEYLDRLDRTISWVENFQRDPEGGEWFAFLTPEGTVATEFGGFGMKFPGTAKGTLNKASYHNGRSMMFLFDMLDAASRGKLL